ncbi:MAG: DNA repair protein RecN [Candidatus Magnetoovum sp. WYHC-5]|nr:DNA repair protein RecN [Candidatus Magnetoovum sp. WYHC-5]
MLREIWIKDFAIVDELRVELSAGLNALTGETGAGKSIIVDALGLIIGQRAQSSLIKAGKKEASIEASFDVWDNPVTKRLDIDTEDGIVIRRLVTSAGKNRIFVNGVSINTQTLIEIGAFLVDILGQNEQHSLLSKVRQLELIDSFANNEEDVTNYKGVLQKYRALVGQKETIDSRMAYMRQRVDLLEYQVNEIDSARLFDINEKEGLLEEQKVLSNLTAIKELAESAYVLIYSGDGSISDNVGTFLNNMSRLAALDSRMEATVSMAEEVQSYVKELAITLRDYKENIEVSPNRLDEVVERLEVIRRLESKYGQGIDGVLAYRAKAVEELEGLKNSQANSEMLEGEIKDTLATLTAMALEISEKRIDTAAELKERVNGLFKELSLDKAIFDIDRKESKTEDGTYNFLPSGIDIVEYLFSANPGEPLKPIQKVASGGELSRVMLALKACFADVDNTPVLVFDEVDAGVGGETVWKVATKLKNISQHHQVLCITHQPQIAAKADSHLRVTKVAKDDSVEVKVELLDSVEREMEIARMLSGSVTDISLQHARQLLYGSSSDGSKKP